MSILMVRSEAGAEAHAGERGKPPQGPGGAGHGRL